MLIKMRPPWLYKCIMVDYFSLPSELTQSICEYKKRKEKCTIELNLITTNISVK